MDGLTDGRMDGQTGLLQYTPQKLRLWGYKTQYERQTSDGHKPILALGLWSQREIVIWLRDNRVTGHFLLLLGGGTGSKNYTEKTVN